MKKYVLKKSPFNCSVIKPGINGLCVALPEKYKTQDVKVFYEEEFILYIPRGKWAKMAIAHRHQPNLYGGGTFLMSYFHLKDNSPATHQLSSSQTSTNAEDRQKQKTLLQ